MARKKKHPLDAAREAEQIANSQNAAAAVAQGLAPAAPTHVAPDSVFMPSQYDALLAPHAEYGAAPIDPSLGKPSGESSLWEGYGFRDYVSDVATQEMLTVNLAIAAREAGFERDPQFKLPAQDSKEWKMLSEGLDPEDYRVFAKAVSLEHAQYLRFKVLDEKDVQRRAMEYGGTVGMLVSGFVNPENLLLGAATGGLAWAQRGSRMARVLKHAGVAGVENAAIETSLYGMQETRDAFDIATSAIGGIALGGAFGGFGKGLPPDTRAAAAAAAKRDLDRLALHEARARGLIDEAGARTAELRLIEAELRAEARTARMTELDKKAEGLPGESGVRAAQRELTESSVRASRVEATLPTIRDRMLAEDIKSMGAQEAMAKHRVKHREAAAKAEHQRAMDGVKAQAETSRKKVRELEEKQQAAAERKRLETPEAVEAVDTRELLGWLKGEHRGAYKARLDSARKGLAEALKTSRRHQRTDPLAAPQRVAPAAAGPSEGTFGRDSAGAARASEDADFSVRDYTADGGQLEPIIESDRTATAFTLFGKRFQLPLPRFDMARTLRGIDSDVARGTGGLYVGDPVGAPQGVNPIGATEVATRIFDTVKSRFHSAYEPSFLKWLEVEKGQTWFDRLAGKNDRFLRKDFGDAVDLAIRVPEGDYPDSVLTAAKRLTKLYTEIGERAHRAGVKGFEDWTPDPKYAPRVLDWLRVGHLDDKFGSAKLESFIVGAVESAYRKAGFPVSPDTEKLISAIGKGYFNTLRTKAKGLEADSFRGVHLDDLDRVASMLEASGVGAVERADLIDKMRRMLLNRGGEGGTVRYGKNRTRLDEQYSAMITDNNGETKEYNFRDLFMERDAEQLFENYARSMSGHIAFAEVAGVRSGLDHQALMAKMSDHIPDDKAREKFIATMDDAYKLATGAPLHETKRYASWRRIGRAMRDYNFVRVMNQVGFAQIPDAAAYLTPQYLRYSRHYMPELFDFMRRAQDGTLDHKLAREAEEWLATGTDYHNNTLYSAFDDEPLSGLSRLEHGLRVAGRVTQSISGLRHTTEFNQRMAGMAVMNRLASNLLGRTADFNEQRLLGLGLTPDKIDGIKKQLAKAEFDGAKHKLLALHLDDWDDPKALNDFLSAVHRETRRMVQEEDVGDTHAWMHSPLGKIVTQFRRFPLVAYSKQLGHGLVHGDMDTLARTGLQVGLGSLSYASQMYLYSLTKPEDEQQEWRDKYLTPKAIFLGGVFRAGMFSLAPQVVSSLYETFIGDTSTDNARTTGMSNGLGGIPAVDLVMRGVGAGSGVIQSALRGDLQFDQKDFAELRRTAPFQNAFVVKQMLDLMQQMLPEGDDDDDDTDWGLRQSHLDWGDDD
jgi:hypothetical protein